VISDTIGPGVFEHLARLIVAIGRPHPTRVAIEGRSAAGKTSFAGTLAAHLEGSRRTVLRAGIDDFHPPGHAARAKAGGYTPQTLYDEGFDYGAFRRLLLDPLGLGGDRQPRLGLHDSFADRPIDRQAVNADDDAILIVDGAFLLRPELRDAWELVIWLDISFATMLARAEARDVAWVGDAAEVRRRYLAHWVPAHESLPTS
jgi:uridine kinase